MLSDSSRTHQPHDHKTEILQLCWHTLKLLNCGSPFFSLSHLNVVCVCMCGGYLTVSVDDWLLAYYIGDISRAVACIVAFRLSSFLMVVWLECLGPLQLPGSAHRYLQVIKKPSDSSEELQSISNEARSSNGIKSRTIASTKETARFATSVNRWFPGQHQWIARRCWTPNLPMSWMIFSYFPPEKCPWIHDSWFKTLIHHYLLWIGISHYIIISSHEITMKSPQTHGWLRWFPRHPGGLCAFAAGSSQHRHWDDTTMRYLSWPWEVCWNMVKSMKSHVQGEKSMMVDDISWYIY